MRKSKLIKNTNKNNLDTNIDKKNLKIKIKNDVINFFKILFIYAHVPKYF